MKQELKEAKLVELQIKIAGLETAAGGGADGAVILVMAGVDHQKIRFIL